MLVVVCGDRHWADYQKVYARLSQLPKGTWIVSGGAKGADTMAKVFATGHQYPFIEDKADWAKHGKAAGPIRNRVMLDRKPDLVIAFHSDLSKSKGTADTVREARRRGITVEVIT